MRGSDQVPIRPERICGELSRMLPSDAIVIADTGHAGMVDGGMRRNELGVRLAVQVDELGEQKLDPAVLHEPVNLLRIAHQRLCLLELLHGLRPRPRYTPPRPARTMARGAGLPTASMFQAHIGGVVVGWQSRSQAGFEKRIARCIGFVPSRPQTLSPEFSRLPGRVRRSNWPVSNVLNFA